MGQDTQTAHDELLKDLLLELGYGGRNEGVARKALEEAGLTRPGRQAIATSKKERVIGTLRDKFVLACVGASCQKAGLADGRTQMVPERPADCQFCGGSDNRQAVERLCGVLAGRGMKKVVVVGGSPAAREALDTLVGSRLQLRLVEGVGRRTKAEARVDLMWADLVIIWGSTQLDHKVSTLYTDSGDDRVVVVHRRGIASMVEELLPSLKAARR